MKNTNINNYFKLLYNIIYKIDKYYFKQLFR